MIKPVLIIISFIILLTGCNSNKYKKLDLINKKNQFINKTNGDTLLVGRVAGLLNYKNNGKEHLLIIDGMTRSVLIVTQNLELVKYISTENYDFLFTGPLKSAALHNNYLFLIDDSPQLKTLNLNNNEIKKFELKPGGGNPLARFNNLKFLPDSTFVISTLGFLTEDVGIYARKYHINGEYINSFTIDLDELEYNDLIRAKPAFETSFVTVYENKVYLSFRVSRMCFEYDLNGKFLKKYKLNIDKKIYREPFVGKYGTFISPVCGGALNISDNKIYQIVVSNPEGPNIFKYDINFNLIEQYKVATPGDGATYECLKIGNQIFYYDRFSPDVYKCIIN